MSEDAAASLPIPSIRDADMIQGQAAEDEADMTDRMKQAIVNLILYDMERGQAAEEAGYAPGTGVPRMWELMRKPQAQTYAASLLRARLVCMGPQAVAKLGVLLDAKSDYVKLEAARTILSGAGITDGKQDKNAGQSLSVTINLGD